LIGSGENLKEGADRISLPTFYYQALRKRSEKFLFALRASAARGLTI
jgi:hypothetical protein